MIWFCLGTAAELIKVYGLIRLCEQRKIPWFVLNTGQSGSHFPKQWADFGLPRERLGYLLESQSDLSSTSQALGWFSRGFILGKSRLINRIQSLAGVSPRPGKDPWIIHGDTLSAVLGASFGRRMGLSVVHLESGLTSGSIWNPFPEELSRSWASSRADICFAPSEEARHSLLKRKVPAKVHCTGGNTLLDCVRLVSSEAKRCVLPDIPYGIVNLHRYENLHHPGRWSRIAETLIHASQKAKLYLLLHNETETVLRSTPGLLDQLFAAGSELLPRKPFVEFVQWMAGARFLISDGGSNQEEASYLGVPCLILRERTERSEGLGSTCLLSQLDPVKIESFLNAPESFRRVSNFTGPFPSESVIQILVREFSL